LEKTMHRTGRNCKRTPEERYVAAAISFQMARDCYDHKTSNRAHERLYAAAREIRLYHVDSGQSFFESLLGHSMPYVRQIAAFNLIPFNASRARAIINELAKGPPGEVRFAAEVTLHEWDSGRLDPNWFMK